jgi:UDP-N-acetylglucosamine 1-carboxyvinyltransferase
MEKFIIRGGHSLSGEIEVRGAKNAATPILAACLLTKQTCTVDNLPQIGDVFRMVEIIKEMGAEVEWLSDRRVKITAKDIDPTKIRRELVGRLRSSVLLFGPLLTRSAKIKIPQPGGCLIGLRPLDTHIRAFEDLGVTVEQNSKYYHFEHKGLKGEDITLREFSVTGTENILMAAVLANGVTRIKLAALEPHVEDLIQFLKKMGAQIKGTGTHTLVVKGVQKLNGASHKIIFDQIEAGTFLILGAATKSPIEVKNADINHLDSVVAKLKEMGVDFEISSKSIKVKKSLNLQAAKIVTRIYPGLPTDLQAPFGVLATQAQGTSLIFDTMYEGRLRYINELKKMGANAIISDPHRAYITGPTPLYGKKITSFDLRAGVTLIIAALLAEGKSEIADAYQVDRGYEKIEERLTNLGADIKRV